MESSNNAHSHAVAHHLRDAVEKVIDQNVSIGYNTGNFRKATKARYADNLTQVCDRLVQKAETSEAPYR